VGTFVLAAATLILETALLRVFALSQGYHFAFVAIGIALLGMGAGGTALAVWQSFGSRHLERPDVVSERGRLAAISLGFAVTTLGSYLWINRSPFDVYHIAWERVQILYLMAYLLALALPFFCSGLAIGLVLETARIGNVDYAANLLGSASGSLIALAALAYVGGAGTVALSAAGGCIAGALYASSGNQRPGNQRLGNGHGDGRWHRVLVLSLCMLGMIGALWLGWVRPPWFEIRLSPYRSLSYARQFPGARVLASWWNAFSRVDVIESSAIHVSPGLSLGYGGQVPTQRGLYVDARAQAALTDPDASLSDWASHLPLALVYRLRPRAQVLILEPGGGLDVAVARSLGAAHVTAVSSNPLVVRAVHVFSPKLYSDTDVEVLIRSPRAFVRGHQDQEDSRFDVIDLALNDAQQMVVSGAYALSEEYDYTVQAFTDYLGLLEPDGVLVVQRWLQTPPSESLRAWALAVETMEQAAAAAGVSEPRRSLVAIRSWSTMLILVKKGNWQASELAAIRVFCDDRQFDLVYLPDLQAKEANRYNVYQGAPYACAFGDLLAAQRRVGFYRGQAYDVRPPTDDRPYFFHFFKWRQVPEIWQTLGRTWQPFGGGGYLVLLALLAIATLASVVLILLPVAFVRRPARGSALPPAFVLAYFGCLGIGYLAVEVPLIQRLVLFLDHPTVAFATVLSVLLIASGVGSLAAPRLRQWWLVPVLVVYLLALSVLLAPLLRLFMARPLAVRIAFASLLLAPLGLLMGVPFPTGLALIQERASGLTPWAWGVNGCTSVIASILTALIAVSWGSSAVLGVAAGVYLLAWGLLTGMRRTKHAC
jgi:hypothetical protein